MSTKTEGNVALLRVEVVSLEGEIYSGVARSVQATGSQGGLGIYPNHAPLLTELVPGPVRIVQEDGQEEIVFVSSGILEVQPWVVTILADTVLRAKDIDEAEVLRAKERALALLQTQRADVDYAMAHAELLRVAGMLRTLQELRSHIR